MAPGSRRRMMAASMGAAVAAAPMPWLFAGTTLAAAVATAAVAALMPPPRPSPSETGSMGGTTVIEKLPAGTWKSRAGNATTPAAPPAAPVDATTREWDEARRTLRSGLASKPPVAGALPSATATRAIPAGPATPSPPSGAVSANASPGRQAAVAPPAAAPDTARWTPEPQPEIMDRAETLLKKGDVTSARLWLAAGAEKGDVDAVFRLAETYDPVTLGQWGVVGMTSDAARARTLYERALAGGMAEARERLDRLPR